MRVSKEVATSFVFFGFSVYHGCRSRRRTRSGDKYFFKLKLNMFTYTAAYIYRATYETVQHDFPSATPRAMLPLNSLADIPCLAALLH